MSANLQIKLLGEFCLTYSGTPITTVNAERLQALLAFLLLHQEAPQSRQQVAIQLWPDATDADAKANLRRRLHELKQALPQADSVLQVQTKTLHWVSGDCCWVDVVAFKTAIARAKQAQKDGQTDRLQLALETAATLYRGDLLPGCYDDWILPLREQLQQQALTALDSLVGLLAGQGESRSAIDYATHILRIDPLCESAYCYLMRLHAQAGDRASALRVYHQCMTVLQDELGVNPSPATAQLYDQLLRLEDEVAPPSPICEVVAQPLAPLLDRSLAPFPAQPRSTSHPPEAPIPLIGREAEWAAIQQWTRSLASENPEMLLLLGEPGIGKTRLLEELVNAVWAQGGGLLWGRGFEAEMLRPYGAWIDAFQALEAGDFLSELRGLLSAESASSSLDRGRLFESATQFMAQLCTRAAPLLVVLDDLQWLDETSIAFLHYALRLLSGRTPVLFACAARKREIEDNAPAYKLIQALNRERRLLTLEIPPLDQAHTVELVRAVGGGIDCDDVFTNSGGNPLFALELGRLAISKGTYSGTLEALIQGRLFQLEAAARDLVPWAAALGRSFNPTVLASVVETPLPRLLSAIEQLEHHGIIRPSRSLDGELTYDFAHDIVRQVAYQQFSDSRRKLVHTHIARALEPLAAPASRLINDVAYHASLGSDHALAATAALRAAERCLRLYAYAEAAQLAQQGITHCPYLDAAERLRLHLSLLRVWVKAGVPKPRASELKHDLQAFVQEAAALGLKDEEATGLEALIVLNYDHGNLGEVQQHSLRAAERGRSASPATTAYMLAHTGSCLAEIGRDIPRAEALLLEAQTIAERLSLTSMDIPFGLGCVRRYQGRAEEAQLLLHQGWQMAQQAQDHWRECTGLTNLVMLALETGQLAQALDYGSELIYVSAQMGEGSEAHHAAALDAVTRYGLQEHNAEETLVRSHRILQQIDSPRMLAFIFTLAAEWDLQQGRLTQALERAGVALLAAQIVDNPSELALAWAILIQAHTALGNTESATQQFLQLKAKLHGKGFSARARQAIINIQ